MYTHTVIFKAEIFAGEAKFKIQRIKISMIANKNSYQGSNYQKSHSQSPP